MSSRFPSWIRYGRRYAPLTEPSLPACRSPTAKERRERRLSAVLHVPAHATHTRAKAGQSVLPYPARTAGGTAQPENDNVQLWQARFRPSDRCFFFSSLLGGIPSRWRGSSPVNRIPAEGESCCRRVVGDYAARRPRLGTSGERMGPQRWESLVRAREVSTTRKTTAREAEACRSSMRRTKGGQRAERQEELGTPSCFALALSLRTGVHVQSALNAVSAGVNHRRRPWSTQPHMHHPVRGDCDPGLDGLHASLIAPLRLRRP